MNGSCETPEEQLCGCCAGTGAQTPAPITNRPDLSAIAYRVGIQPEFKSSLLAALSDSDLPALAGLTTRDNRDFSIALLDAWAVALDILTFYQERLANESYLGTAVESRSVFELARLVGYQPSPGVAASTFIAFALNDAPGSPETVPIPASTRVQSVPAPGQTPQTFETSSDLTALIEHNALPAETALPWSINPGDTSIWLQGAANNLNPGDGLLFVSSGLRDGVLSGSSSPSSSVDFHLITSVVVNSNAGNTFVTWDGGLTWPNSNDSAVYIYVFRKKAGLFGAQSPDPRTLTGVDLSNVPGNPTSASQDWDWSYPWTPEIDLDATYAGLGPVKDGEPQWVLLSVPKARALYHISAAQDAAPMLYTVTSKATHLTLEDPQILYNNSSVLDDQILGVFVLETRNALAYVQSELLTPASAPYTAWSYDGTYSRQQGLLKPVEGSNLEIVGGQRLAEGDPVAVFGKRLRLQVRVGSSANFVPDKGTGALAVSDGQVFLVEGFPPSLEFFLRRLGFRRLATLTKLGTLGLGSGFSFGGFRILADQVWQVVTTDGVSGSLHVSPGQIMLLPSDKADASVSEGAMISQFSVSGPITTLCFDQPLMGIYDRATVSVNANVVDATNGETVHEILGSGDATNAALSYTLKQTPLTFVSSSSPTGSTSTLQVWVNNLQWHEVDNFLSSGPDDRVFVTRVDDSGNVTVQFGDGDRGARPPTGQMNIRAVYRKGIGAAGNVQAGQLTQPLDRPQGLKSSTNPDAATGGADPDSADAARASAPLHVLTLDRVVSLEDYGNFARAFAGIEKALSTWTWFGSTRGVFLTIAGANGGVFKDDDATVVNLAKALRSSGNPFIPLQIDSYRPVLFELGANLKIDTADYDPDLVLATAWQGLLDHFGFEQRQLGQGVAQSEVIALLQAVPGVIAVALTDFNRQGADPISPLPVVLQAASPAVGGDGTPQAAEMLLLDPASKGGLGVWS